MRSRCTGGRRASAPRAPQGGHLGRRQEPLRVRRAAGDGEARGARPQLALRMRRGHACAPPPLDVCACGVGAGGPGRHVASGVDEPARMGVPAPWHDGQAGARHCVWGGWGGEAAAATAAAAAAAGTRGATRGAQEWKGEASDDDDGGGEGEDEEGSGDSSGDGSSSSDDGGGDGGARRGGGGGGGGGGVGRPSGRANRRVEVRCGARRWGGELGAGGGDHACRPRRSCGGC